MMDLKVSFNVAFGSLTAVSALLVGYSPIIRHFEFLQKKAALTALSTVLTCFGEETASAAEKEGVLFTTSPDLAAMARVQRGALATVLVVTAFLLLCVQVLSLGVIVGWSPNEIDKMVSLLTLVATVPIVCAMLGGFYSLLKLHVVDVIKGVAQVDKIKSLFANKDTTA